jgi:predicted esterase
VRETRGGLDSTPVYLGCSDRDAHIPLPFVEESARVLLAQGASVTQSIFPGMGHTVNDEEIAEFKGLLSAAAATP